VTAGQMVQRRASHPSNTEHDGIVMGHRCPLWRSRLTIHPRPYTGRHPTPEVP
jgi:hypothetical protein